MRRREFGALSGAAAAWPLAGARNRASARRIGILLNAACGTICNFRLGLGGDPAGAGAVGLEHRLRRGRIAIRGPRPIPPTFGHVRRNWPRSRRMSF